MTGPAAGAAAASGPGVPARPWTVLLVCTGNICRSPMAELVAAAAVRSALGEQLADAATLMHSAGVAGWTGEPMDPRAAAVLTARGLDPGAFRARRLTEDLVRGADLVLCAAREHRFAVVAAVPGALRRAFTIREFGRGALPALARAARAPSAPAPPPPAVGGPAGAGRDDAARVAAALRSLGAAVAADLLAQRTGGAVPVPPASDDDITDPLAAGLAEFEACAEMISQALFEPLRALCLAALGAAGPPSPTAASAAGAAPASRTGQAATGQPG